MKQKMYDFAHLHAPSLFESEDIAQGVERKLDALAAIYASAVVSMTSIRKSKALTPKGKQDQLVDLQAEVEKKMKDWQKANQHYADYAKQLEGKMTPKNHRPDDVVRFLKEQEIRRELKGIDILEVEVMYREAVEQGDDLIADAVEHAPLPYRFATKDLVETLRFDRMATHFPEESLILKDVRVAQEQAQSALASARVELHKYKIDTSAEDVVAAAAA